MLSLKHISKKYGDSLVLNNISIDFRNKELVAILGESGSGKSTLLNIIGGLDKYDSGNLLIEGISTKKYKSKDWDNYREQKLGFVFQSYHLIEHLSVRENVNSSLLFRKKENNKESLAVIDKVGLSNLVKRNVKDLSGGEKQRVAIARALVKNPEILLCDEPTGALDSKNGMEIMKILKEVSKSKLVIMVTHSEELALQYADRIVRIKDGQIVCDSDEYKAITLDNKKNIYKKKRLKIIEAIRLSYNNLKLRKRRTLLVSIAGSIGIIGIALIISLANGVEGYIKGEEEKTLASYPITINKTSYDYKDIYLNNNKGEECPIGQICSSDDISNSDELIDAMALKENDLIGFKKYLDNNKDINKLCFINYLYNIDLNVYSDKGNIVNPSNINITNSNLLREDNDSLLKEMPDKGIVRDNRYELLSGEYPKSYNEIVLVVDGNNSINLSTLYKLDIKDKDEYYDLINKVKNKEKISIDNVNLDYNNLLNKKYKLVLNAAYYKKENDKYSVRKDINNLLKESEELSIVGIVKEKDGEGNYIGYTKSLLEYVVNKNKNSSIYQDQINNKEINVISGEKINNDEEYEAVLKKIGVIDLNNPDSIVIYSNNKKEVEKLIEKYNPDNNEKIYYVDMMSVLLDTLNTIIKIVTYVLTSLVAISLIVSSIMIAIITYISVLERSKEIGILKTMGASNKDIQRLFKMETMIEGLLAGLIGVIIANLLTYPMNKIISKLIKIESIVKFDWKWALLLIVVSVLLTVIAGLIPARKAAKLSVVDALRSE